MEQFGLINFLKRFWERVISVNSGKISKSELTRKVQDKKDFDYSESLQTLIDRGYIRIERIITGANRPTETTIVNPEAVK
jgi:hypothetical protein